MGKDIENFRDQLTKLAESVEILENSFLINGDISVTTKLPEEDFNKLMRSLNNQSKENRCVLSIGNVDFIFLNT
jgi:hypothetical protein